MLLVVDQTTLLAMQEAAQKHLVLLGQYRN